jgi:SAM-dependent methyltransferase
MSNPMSKHSLAQNNSYALATKSGINNFRSSNLCHQVCGEKPFGSRHWEYPWCIEQSEIMGKSNLRILDVAPDFTFPYASLLDREHTVTFIDLEQRRWSDSVTWGAKVRDLASKSDYRVMDVKDMVFSENTFDIIFCISVLEHIVCPTQDPNNPNLKTLFLATAARKALKEMRRCLKPTGKLLLTIDLYGGPKWQAYFNQWDIICDLKEAGFETNHFPRFDRQAAFADPETFVSHFHGPYITLGFKLNK